MKVKYYRFMYRIASLLTDKTNGFKLFARYKLMIGTLLVGLNSASCTDEEKEPELTCYDSTPSIEKPEGVDNPAIPPNEGNETDDEPVVTCYIIAPIDDAKPETEG